MRIWFLRVLLIFQAFSGPVAMASEVSITMDDPEVNSQPLLSSEERNLRILDALDSFKIKAALFVCGKRIDSSEGNALLQAWDKKGHLIGNHTYSHLNFSATDFDLFSTDAFKVEPLLTSLKNFQKIFRFPMLKEGDTREKRDGMRELLKKRGYRLGYVTIDASDWAIDGRLRAKLKKNPNADLKPYRDFYLQHIWDRAQFYDNLAKKVYGHEIKHTLLIHHSLLNALFLKDLLKMFEEKGWKLISAKEAFSDPIFKEEPNIIPAGEGLVWAKAKESGKFESRLRYPAENDEYENPKMDQLGL